MKFELEVTLQNRKALYYFLKTLSLDELNKIPSGYNNNIIWNIGHTIATQQSLVYGLSGLPTLVSTDFIMKYKKGTRPEQNVTSEEVDAMKVIIFSTVEKTLEDYEKGKFKTYKEYNLSSIQLTLRSIKEAVNFNNFHEGLHLGYIMALLKLVK
jgi:hypothetical protein